MLVSERRRLLVEVVQGLGAARVEELAKQLGVSGMTVRRDIEDLVADDRLVKVQGGVRLPSDGAISAWQTSLGRHRPEKEAVAVAAAGLVDPGFTVGVSGGSTAWCLARHLRKVPGLTMVTNSLAVADLFDEAPRAGAVADSAAVVLTGGVRTATRALVGPVAVRSLTGLHCDVVFVGVNGIDPAAGLTTPNLMEAETDRALLATGARAVVVADRSKWRTVSLTTIVDLDAVDVVVTDDGLAPAEVAILRGHVREVVLAPRIPTTSTAG